MSNQPDGIYQSVSGQSGVSQQVAKDKHNSQLTNQDVHLSKEKKDLAEAAAEIQRPGKEMVDRGGNQSKAQTKNYCVMFGKKMLNKYYKSAIWNFILINTLVE